MMSAFQSALSRASSLGAPSATGHQVSLHKHRPGRYFVNQLPIYLYRPASTDSPDGLKPSTLWTFLGNRSPEPSSLGRYLASKYGPELPPPVDVNLKLGLFREFSTLSGMMERFHRQLKDAIRDAHDPHR